MDDDDDDEKQEAKYEFSEESKLDEDHLFYLQFTNNFISNVTRPRDFDHCTRWLERLAGEPMYGVEAKRNRNMYLAMLLCAMQDNKVKGPFASFPPPGPLANAAVAFGLTSPEDDDQGSMMFDETDRELNMSEYQYKSEDGRTYLATCALPNNGGVLAFVGLSFGGGEGFWINKQGMQVRQRDEEERLQVITPKTPLKKQIEMVEEHKEILRKGLDQFETELGDDAFKFLTDLPLSTSDSNLLEIGSYRFSNENSELLLEVYPAELIDLLQEFLVVSKKEIEKRLRTRHEKIIKGFYAEYSAEIERGLREYKEARLEWATVYQVVAELKETLSQREAKDADTNVSFDAGNRPTGVLVSSLNDAKKRQKTQYENGQALDAKKVELHKEIHDRAMFHMHEIEKMQSHVDKLTTELCLLRRDARKKQMVIQSLYMQSGKNMMR